MANIRVIIGEDDYLVSETAKKTVGDGVGLEVVDSLNASNAELQMADLRRVDESLSTPPFLDPRKVTWWKNVGFLPGSRASEEVKAALEKFAAKLAATALPDNQRFVLSGPHMLKTSLFARRLSKVAEIVTFEPEKPWAAARSAAARAEAFAAEAGLAFAPGAADRFVAVVGTDARSISSEVAKMRDYLGEGRTTISPADVAAVASPGAKVEAEVWDVTDAIGERNAARALEAMRKFELENGFAVFMSGVVEKLFRQLIDVKEGRTGGMSPFAVKKNTAFAARWDVRELRVARARFLALRERVVSGTTAGDVLVVSELLRALRRPAPAVRRPAP